MQQFNGQRKFWNPKWDKPIPPRGCEVFVGKIPRNLFEDELVPVFEKVDLKADRLIDYFEFEDDYRLEVTKNNSILELHFIGDVLTC